MSKQNSNNHRGKNVDSFDTVDGRSWKLQPVSIEFVERAVRAVEADYREAGRAVDPPTYEVEVVGGDKVKYVHTAETVKDHPEHEEAWIAYRQTWQAIIDEQNNIRSRLLLTEGLVITEVPEAWVKRCQKYHIPVAEDIDDRIYDYIMTDVLKTPEDIVRALAVIQQYSVTGHLTEEDIAAAIDTFRNYMASQDKADTTERVEAESGAEVGTQLEIVPAGDDQGLGQATE